MVFECHISVYVYLLQIFVEIYCSKNLPITSVKIKQFIVDLPLFFYAKFFHVGLFYATFHDIQCCQLAHLI